MRRLVMTVAALVLLVAACGDDEPAATSGAEVTTPGTEVANTTEATEMVDFPAPIGALDVVLRMAIKANQPDPLAILEVVAEFTLYGDGTLLVADPDTRGADLPGLIEFQVDPTGIQLLLNAAADHGALDPLDSYGSTDVADGDTTSFVVDAGSVQTGFGVYDLAGESGDVTAEQLAARGSLVELRNLLRDYRTLLGSHIVSERPYALQAVAVFGLERGSGADVGFPFDLEVAGESIETRVLPVQCLIVTGSDVDVLTTLLTDAEPVSRWLINGNSWAIVLRPVLPDEGGCAELAEG